MKTTTRLLVILLALTVVLSLFACGGNNACTSHKDADNDGNCDVCGAAVENENNNNDDNKPSDIALISDGKVNFQIVHASNVGGGVMMAINTLKMNIESAGGSLDIVADKADTAKDVEVLIGDVTTRGEKYKYDKYSLGAKGYIIKLVDNKILVNAGSADTLVDVVEIFMEDILGIKSSTKTLEDVTMTQNKEILKIQDDYRITSVKINGEEINGYTIAYDKNNDAHATAASALNKFLYEKAGYYLPLVSLSEAGKSIIFEAVDYAGEEGFLIETDDSGALRVQCAYSNMFEKAWNEFSNELRVKTGDIDFSSTYRYTYEVSVVYYDDYLHLSVKGNDYPALEAAHNIANKGGQLVKAGRGKTYTITTLTSDGEHYRPIFIRTNVDWGNATIRIDDTCMTSVNDYSNNEIFVVASKYAGTTLTAEENKDEIEKLFPGGVIDADTMTQLGSWDYGYKAIIAVYNDKHKNYIRSGGDANNGSFQHELIVVDENGVIDPTTYFLLDYEEITSVVIRRADEQPLTITGGKFITIANDTPLVQNANGRYTATYFRRGIGVTRSNVTLKDAQHYITGEISSSPSDSVKGPSYSGFFVSGMATDVTFENCILTAHRYYNVCGSYDFSADLTNNIVLKNCKQSNYYILDENGESTGVISMSGNMYWGVGGTNYCKNMVYDGCELTRYDAHCGLYNGKIINSKVSTINLIGGGEMLIENCDLELLSNGNIVNLRQDYGATWKGTVTVKDCRIKTSANVCTLIGGSWTNHYYGYLCHVPSVIASGLTYFDTKGVQRTTNSVTVAIYKKAVTEEQTYTPGDDNKNVLQAPAFVKIDANGYSYVLYYTDFFKHTTIEGQMEYK